MTLAKNIPEELRPKKDETETGYKIIVAVLVAVVIALMAVALWASQSRLSEYNNYVCGEVYGRNDDCSIK